MDEFDRDRSSRNPEPYTRRRPIRDELADDLALPPDSAAERGRSSRTRGDYGYEEDLAPDRATRDRSAQPSESGERYADRFRRRDRTAPAADEPDDRSYRSTRDPYDRLRRVSSRPPRRVEVEDDLDAIGGREEYFDERIPAAARSPRMPRRAQPRDEPSRFRTVGTSLVNPAAEMRPLAIGGIAALASLLLLSILILVRSGSVDVWIPLHLNAEGEPTGYGTRAALWRLPFFAFLTTVMALGVGWWLRTREAFATQYLIVGALLIHGLLWVGAINLLW